MDQEQSWISIQTVGDDDNTAATNYNYFMRPEPRDNLGPIKLEYDKVFGRKTKVRYLRIGMTRNAKDDNRKEVKAYLEPYPHMRIEKGKPLQGWYKSKIEPKGVRPRPCYTEAILTEPYGGWCAVGCAFCYVNSGFRGYRGTGLITVPMNYGEQVRDQLVKVQRGAAVYFSSFTDPFLPLEQYYHNTQQAASECVKVGLPIFFLSRLRYPKWAITLMQMNSHSYAQKSINTCEQKDWERLSPGAMSLAGHFQDITRIKKAGVYVSIQCNPIVPGITSHIHIQKLFSRLAKAGADHVIVKFVEAGYSWAPTMVERMIKRFGDRGREFADLFCENIGGQRTVAEEYRIKAHERYSMYARKAGLTYAVCYEYEYERDENGEIVDKTGVSLGPKFTTSDQCHGHRVPVYVRVENKFRPLEECPPSGCLYCASDNGGKPRCGDDLAGQAKALKLVDLKTKFGE